MNQQHATRARMPAHPMRPTRRVRVAALVTAGLSTALLLLTACSGGSPAGGDPNAPVDAAHPRTDRGSAPDAPARDTAGSAARVTVSSLGASSQQLSTGPATGHTPTTSITPPATPPTTPSAPAATITTGPQPLTDVDPATPITVTVTGGTLTSVQLVNPNEKRTVHGAMAADRHSWTSTEVLGYGKTYTLDARAVNATGETSRRDVAFDTLTPGNMTMPYLDRIGGDALGNGNTYGVGIVPVVHFDEPIANKKAAERALHVTTSPHVTGSWYWADDKDVHWRPEKFWAPGTKVTVAADVYGVEVGDDLYGQADVSASFTIGRRQVTQAYDNAPHGVDKVKVYDGAGKLLRTMNTSMGKHGGVTVKGHYINFYTMDGTYTVLKHQNPAMMSSASYGLPADAPGGYKPEPIYYSTRISTDGIYLHELRSTIWAQNHGADVSHGCLNLDRANASWFYTHSMIGDPVIVHGATGAPAIQVWQGGDWSVPWAKWLAGSALH